MADEAKRPMGDAPSADAVYTEPIVGWRFWRLRRLETYGEERPLRLAAAGRFGIPKFWEPRAATRAVCSSYHTSHDAPWPSCRCGIYGLREEDVAERALLRYARGDLERWAFGRVLLWGRIVEGDRGWRAEYAYPYDVAVFADHVAAELRDLYAVDVTVAAPPAPRGRHRGRRDEERSERARARYEEWLRGLGEATAAGLVTSEEELARAVGKTLRFRVRVSSSSGRREARVERNRWDARA